ncbi:putative protein N(5)-glutamine methyltransferase [Nocardioides sp. GY 10127]|uniref:putative protein N(5)-glutamine methyltransferase n=1 Tax=Nocardioides sp. GY 10127 TaxID=2569762 RepID=UPI0010A84B47|nr:putative protein N(5)-glutamine methyltransferase [Nocardioides sp. GY 10127]TIC79375.1 putative protein N(5)-glutamine methyltransferase [Nocardioides sp. GY 10127]
MEQEGADRLVARLRAAGCVFAEQEAAALLGEAAEVGLDAEQLERLVVRRERGEPLEVVLGHAELGGVRVRTAAGVFVPRQRSMLLARLAAEHLAGLSTPLPRDTQPADAAHPVLIDLCCGTGALGLVTLSLLAAQGGAARVEVHAADLDPAATACAAQNLPDASVHTGDLFEPLPPTLRGRVDVLLVNAPYVPSDAVASMPPEARDHEPLFALDGGPDGLDLHRRVAAEAADWLRPGGLVLLEASVEQAPVSAALLRAAGLQARVVSEKRQQGEAAWEDEDAGPGGCAVLGTRPAGAGG